MSSKARVAMGMALPLASLLGLGVAGGAEAAPGRGVTAPVVQALAVQAPVAVEAGDRGRRGRRRAQGPPFSHLRAAVLRVVRLVRRFRSILALRLVAVLLRLRSLRLGRRTGRLCGRGCARHQHPAQEGLRLHRRRTGRAGRRFRRLPALPLVARRQLPDRDLHGGLRDPGAPDPGAAGCRPSGSTTISFRAPRNGRGPRRRSRPGRPRLRKASRGGSRTAAVRSSRTSGRTRPGCGLRSSPPTPSSTWTAACWGAARIWRASTRR